MAVVDLDHFKLVNDESGHDAGDLLLQRVATALRSGVERVLGGGALVSRWGGDEFVVIGSCSPGELAKALDAARTLLPDGASCSAGVTALHPGDTPSGALSRADSALYEVKRGTRGGTVVDLSPAPAPTSV